MKDQIIPLNCIRQLQFQKYKTAMIPIVVILGGFILRLSGIEIPYSQYIMGIALLGYVAVLFIYRFGNPIVPEQSNILVSPVHGKILSVEQINGMVRIQIAKSFFDPVELRCPAYLPEIPGDSDILIQHGENEIQLSFGQKTPFFFHEPGKMMGSLLGLVPGSYLVTLKFNDSILASELRLQKGDILKAGETILAELKEPKPITS